MQQLATAALTALLVLFGSNDVLFEEEVVSEEPVRPSEQYLKGGRDTVLLAWGVTGLIIAGFMLCSAAARAPPAPTMSSVAP